MKEKKKIPWGLIYVGLTVVVMIVFGLVNTEFAGMFSVIANLSLGFVAFAVLMTGVFLMTEGGIIHMLRRAQGEHVGFWTTVKIGLIGIYYSYITPSSTGGQPAQVVYLRRDKVSVGNSTAVLFVKFFAYQLAFVLCTVASLIYMYPSLKRDDPQLFSPKILKKLCGGVTKLLLKCTFLKKRENYMEKVHGFEADFSSYTMKFRSKMRYVLLAILWSIPQVILQMSVLYVVFRAFSLDLPYGELLCMQTMLQASVCFIPLPGASGAQELGFSMFFKSYFASGDILYTAVLVWRFFTYYIIVLLGALVVVIDQLVFGCRRKQEAALSAGKE